MIKIELNSAGDFALGLRYSDFIDAQTMGNAAFVYRIIDDPFGFASFVIFKDRFNASDVVDQEELNRRLQQTRDYYKDKAKVCFDKVKIGSTILSKATSLSYVVTGNFGDRLTAVRTVDITNPSEWEVIP